MTTKKVSKKTSTKTTRATKLRAVLVSTAHRGIFFGYTAADGTEETIKIERSRMIVYHSADSRGFVGTAAIGPGTGARVSPAALSMVLRNITGVVDVSPEAIKKIEAGPWRS